LIVNVAAPGKGISRLSQRPFDAYRGLPTTQKRSDQAAERAVVAVKEIVVVQ
jgi:hypothetical protein